MAIDPKRELDERLAELLERVIDWLHFAESKNTGLVGLTSTALGLVAAFLLEGPPVPTPARVGLAIGTMMLMLSLLLVLASFFPATDLERYVTAPRDSPRGGDNLLFYGHLARYEPHTLVRAVTSHYVEGLPAEVSVSKLAGDLAGQIVINARITVRKLRLYRYALLLFGTGVIIAAAAIALAVFLG